MNKLPMVTVVITTYKREPKMVRRAIDSVINQTYSNIQIIVVDDSPNTYELRDSIKDMVLSYKKIIYIQHEKSKGACIARNTGLQVAKGEYIAYLDDDDEWMPNKIEKQLKCFDDEETAIVYCGHKEYHEAGNVVVDTKCKGYSGYLYEKLLQEGNFIGSTSFVLMKKDYLKKIGGFDPLMESAQDADVWLRLAKKYKISFVDESLVVYHIHDGERITTNYKKKINGITRLIEKNKDYINVNSKVYSRYCRELALLYACDGELRHALYKWGEGIVKKPSLVLTHITCLLQLFVKYVRREW